VTTFLRPVLWRPSGQPLFRLSEKMFFLEHFGHVFDVPAVDATPEKAEPEKMKPESGTKPAGPAGASAGKVR
jgi:hypothetical protein